jgi:alpha-ketoglutaric semialdehyde dehydrogenase
LTATVENWIDGEASAPSSGEHFEKVSPVTGQVIARVARSNADDVDLAVKSARAAQPAWAALTPVHRGDLIRNIAGVLAARRDEVASVVAAETGKSRKDAGGEVDAAIEMGYFVAGEGRRFYGRTTTSATLYKSASIIRQPLGVAGLIVAANTPAPNVAWKAFPALLCGNAAVLKSSENTPLTADLFASIFTEAGIPDGVFNVIQGLGPEAGAPLAEHPGVDVVSFTGSRAVGQEIGRVAGGRLAKVCLELGGKNPLVVCDDADLDRAVEAAVGSAFSNAGQRCASGSRLIVFDAVYDTFKERLLARMATLRVGSGDDDDFGPVINERQLEVMLAAVQQAATAGATVLAGGTRVTDGPLAQGFYMSPTLIEEVAPSDPISETELFGPIATLYRVASFDEALELSNLSPYGLTAAIHTASVHRAQRFLALVQAGVAVVNGATYGSEPHMPFGGVKQSGNGAREAGTEALDVYSDWKTIYVNHDPTQV